MAHWNFFVWENTSKISNYSQAGTEGCFTESPTIALKILTNCTDKYSLICKLVLMIKQRESKHIKVARAICCQVVANQISLFPVDIDQLPKYGSARVKVYCLCMAIFIKGLYMLRFPLFGSLLLPCKMS